MYKLVNGKVYNIYDNGICMYVSVTYDVPGYGSCSVQDVFPHGVSVNVDDIVVVRYNYYYPEEAYFNIPL